MRSALERAAAEQQHVDCDELFELLYRRYEDDVFRFARRIMGGREDAEDVAQITFLNAYRALARGRPPRQPRAWLLAIARNVCSKRFRARRHRPREVPLDPERFEALPGGDGATAEELRSALDRLSLEHRSALVMRELAELSYAEIAARLGVSIPAVESRLFRARRALRHELEEAELRPTVRPREDGRKRRRLGLLFPWPADLGRPFGWAGSLGRAGLGKAAAAVTAASVIGTGAVVGTRPVPVGVSVTDEPPSAPAWTIPPTARLAPTPGSAVRPGAGVASEKPSVPSRPEPPGSEGASLPSAPQAGSQSSDASLTAPTASPELSKLEIPELPGASLPEPPPLEVPDVPATPVPEPPELELPDLPDPPLPEPEPPELESPDLPPPPLPPPPASPLP